MKSPNTHEELTRLEILEYLKNRFSGDGTRNLSPFEEHQVVRYGTRIESWHVPEIHEEVRESIKQIVTGIQDGSRQSQVVILAGDPGMGKTHLLNYFRNPQRAEELGYLFLCNSNHWKVDEFESCLLDWMLDALTRPSPLEPHALLEKIEDIAFQALTQLLARPGQIQPYLSKQSRGFVSRWWNKVTRRWPGSFQEAVAKRDPAVFRELDFAKFADFVGQRFLHEPGNPFHRYALSVLLRYLFPEDRDKTIGWLRRRPVGDYFQRLFGVSDAIDQHHKVLGTIKILISLFTADVEKNLGSDAMPGKAFFFAFDQLEGRDELFDKEEDWTTFFAQLSELYNALPNVFILFTMTIRLRETLYPRMERQFQQRISRDQKFVLHEPEPAHYLAIYRRHLDRWLGDVDEKLQLQFKEPQFLFSPFTSEQVVEFCQRKTTRDSLIEMDRKFRETMLGVVTRDPRRDFLVALNEFKRVEEAAKPHGYVEDHLVRIVELLNRHGGILSRHYGMIHNGMDNWATDDRLPALRLEFRHPERNELWVRCYIAVFGHQYTSKVEGCVDLLKGLHTDRNFLWMLRADKIDAGLVQQKQNQAFAWKFDLSDETTFRAMLHLLQKQEDYDSERWRIAEQVIHDEFKNTYLGRVFQFLAESLEKLNKANAPSVAVAAEVKP
jgi:hypothetical protein